MFASAHVKCFSSNIHVFTNYFLKFIKCSGRESLMKDLESSVQQKKDDIARFEEERTDLIAKVQL